MRGAIVEDVVPGSPADRAGLLTGDVITRIQNRPVANAGSVQATVGIAPPGTALTLVYLRDGQSTTALMTVETESTAAVQLGSSALQAYGANIRTLTAADGKGDEPGLIVVAVEGGSPAAQQDLRAGDVITAVAGETVTSLADLAAALADSGALTVRRDGEVVELSITPGT